VSRRAPPLAGPAAVVAALAVVAACGGGGTALVETRGSTGSWVWSLPAHFPEPKVPADNPMSVEKVELGRFLFCDKRLSGNGLQACAGCHAQDKAFTDGRTQSVGSTGELYPRGAQHLSNVVYNATLTWANPSLVTLERQMETPLFGERPIEMGVNDANKEAVLQRLRDDTGPASYPLRSAAAFPGGAAPISWGNGIKAISTFQRTLISGNSRYDQWLAGRTAFSAAEQRGMNLFFGEKAECFHCHGSFNLNDRIVHAGSRIVETPFSNTGLYNIGGTGAFPEPNRGVFELTARADDMGKFRAPSLRNVEVTAPYMHDGTVATLEDVLAFYAAGGRNITSGPHAGDGRANPFKSELVARIALSGQEQADIVAFLKSLTDHDFLTDPRHADPFVTR
jgi:cytochrome c peroxidase